MVEYRHEELSLAIAGANLQPAQGGVGTGAGEATSLAREAIDLWLKQQLGKVRHAEIAAFAAESAGTPLDLNPGLESAGVEHMLKGGKGRK
jgi:hypothetical protein